MTIRGVIFLVLLLGCSSPGLCSHSHGKYSKSDREINAIGRRDIAYKDINTYVEQMAQKVAHNSDARMPITVRVVDSSDVYAATLPGGYQYVTFGLLLRMDDECELASVLARGIAHTALRSATSEQSRVNTMQMMTTPLIFLGSSSSALGVGSTLPLTMVKFRREEETDADYFGIQYVYKSGYDSECFVRAIRTIWSLPRYSDMPTSFSYFPPLSLRIVDLRKEIGEILPKLDSATTTMREFIEFREHLLSLAPPKQEPTSEPKLIRADPEPRQ